MIRAAVAEDARAIAEVHVRARFRAYQDILDPADLAGDPVDEREERWRGMLLDTGVQTLVAEVAGRVCGFASVRGTDLLALYVDPPAQGAGVGSALLTAAEAAIGPGPASLRVYDANGHGRHFYENRGWAWDGAPPVLIEGAPDVRYTKVLPA